MTTENQDQNQTGQAAGSGAPINPFAIFNTSMEDIKLKEETGVNYDNIYFEPDPKLSQTGVYTVAVKLLLNIYNPQMPVSYKYQYKLKRPNNPAQSFYFDSPSTVNQPCPAMEKWFATRNDLDPRIKAISNELKRQRKAACVVQIINDAQRPELNGQIRIFRFTQAQEIDNMITTKMNPSEADKKMLINAENVFDIFESRYLILRVGSNDYGRDFSKSSWSDNKGGMFIPAAKLLEIGETLAQGVTGRFVTKEDGAKPEIQKVIIGMLQEDSGNIKEYFEYKSPDEAMLNYVRDAIAVMYGEKLPMGAAATTAPVATAGTVAQPVHTAAQPTEVVQQPLAQQPLAQQVILQPEAPILQTVPAQQVMQPPGKLSNPAQQVVVTQPAAADVNAMSDDAFMSQLLTGTKPA